MLTIACHSLAVIVARLAPEIPIQLETGPLSQKLGDIKVGEEPLATPVLWWVVLDVEETACKSVLVGYSPTAEQYTCSISWVNRPDRDQSDMAHPGSAQSSSTRARWQLFLIVSPRPWDYVGFPATEKTEKHPPGSRIVILGSEPAIIVSVCRRKIKLPRKAMKR